MLLIALFAWVCWIVVYCVRRALRYSVPYKHIMLIESVYPHRDGRVITGAMNFPLPLLEGAWAFGANDYIYVGNREIATRDFMPKEASSNIRLEITYHVDSENVHALREAVLQHRIVPEDAAKRLQFEDIDDYVCKTLIDLCSIGKLPEIDRHLQQNGKRSTILSTLAHDCVKHDGIRITRCTIVTEDDADMDMSRSEMCKHLRVAWTVYNEIKRLPTSTSTSKATNDPTASASAPVQLKDVAIVLRIAKELRQIESPRTSPQSALKQRPLYLPDAPPPRYTKMRSKKQKRWLVTRMFSWTWNAVWYVAWIVLMVIMLGATVILSSYAVSSMFGRFFG